MNTDNEAFLNDGDAPVAPAVVMPGVGATTTPGGSLGTGTIPILPALFAAGTDATGSGGLASRLEQRLAEDGRFSPLLPTLNVAADDATGHVTLTGTAPDPDLLPFLLSSLRAVPGVTGVTDRTG